MPCALTAAERCGDEQAHRAWGCIRPRVGRHRCRWTPYPDGQVWPSYRVSPSSPGGHRDVVTVDWWNRFQTAPQRRKTQHTLTIAGNHSMFICRWMLRMLQRRGSALWVWASGSGIPASWCHKPPPANLSERAGYSPSSRAPSKLRAANAGCRHHRVVTAPSSPSCPFSDASPSCARRPRHLPPRPRLRAAAEVAWGPPS